MSSLGRVGDSDFQELWAAPDQVQGWSSQGRSATKLNAQPMEVSNLSNFPTLPTDS